MSLLKKLGFGKTAGKAAGQDVQDLAAGLRPQAGSEGREKRAHKRYALGAPPVMYIDFGGGTLVAINDVSYGGFVAQVADVPPSSRQPGGSKARMWALTDSVEVTAAYIYSRGSAAAFRFHHDTPDALLFLREPLESMRLGNTLTAISGDMLKAPYNQPGWMCLRGDGPTDLVMSADPKGTLREALMTFRQGESYKEISLKENTLKTSRSIDTSGHSATRMAQTDVIDVQTLKIALYLLSGISEVSTKKLSDQLIQLIYNHLPEKPGR